MPTASRHEDHDLQLEHVDRVLVVNSAESFIIASQYASSPIAAARQACEASTVGLAVDGCGGHAGGEVPRSRSADPRIRSNPYATSLDATQASQSGESAQLVREDLRARGGRGLVGRVADFGRAGVVKKLVAFAGGG